MVRVVVVLAVLVTALSGCGQANSPAEKQEKGGVEKAQKQLQDADLPAYSVTQEEDCTVAWGYPMKCYVVCTDATSKRT